MPNSRERIKARLGKLELSPRREEEILRELAEHLEDQVTALEARGVARGEAEREAFNTVSDWSELRKEILLAETEETTMNYRAKVFWLPALCALTLSYGLLAIMQFIGPLPHFDWLSPHMSMRPYFTFYVPWLISQPIVGAVAACVSRRAGGDILHQLLAALAPPIALLVLFLLILPFSLILDVRLAPNLRLSAFLVLTASWVLLPSLPLLIGAAPFLRRVQPQG
jgi:hypothetical protein